MHPVTGPLFLILFCVQTIESDLSNFVSPCTTKSPEFGQCLRKLMQALVPKVSKYGWPEFGLNSLDPLYIPEMTFNYESLTDIAGKMIVNNTTAKGLSNIKIAKVRSVIIDKRIFSMDVDFTVPKFTLSGNFEMNGRVSLFPVSGSGPYNITTGEVNGVWRLRGIPVKLGGIKYLRLTQFGMKPTLGYFKLHAENVVKGNPKLSRMVVAFTNRFWSLLYYQTLPYFEKNFEEIGKDILNKLFLQIPYDKLFPG